MTKILTTITTIGAPGARIAGKILEKCEKSPKNHWIFEDGLHNMEIRQPENISDCYNYSRQSSDFAP